MGHTDGKPGCIRGKPGCPPAPPPGKEPRDWGDGLGLRTAAKPEQASRAPNGTHTLCHPGGLLLPAFSASYLAAGHHDTPAQRHTVDAMSISQVLSTTSWFLRLLKLSLRDPERALLQKK